MRFIYLDHNATTPVHPEAAEAMTAVLRNTFGNPSSVHAAGRAARVLVDEAREQVAALIHARPVEIVFTGSGTEANNLAIKGRALAIAGGHVPGGRHILTSRVEHASVLNPCRELEALGFEVEFLPVDSCGRVDPEAVARSLRADTALLSIQHANNEVGVLQGIDAIGRMARERGVLFHVDAVQSAGKIPLDVELLPADMLTISAHKFGGPKGVGALYIRRGTPPLTPLVSGGAQERKRRGGTENVPGIVGFGRAAVLARERLMHPGTESLRELRDRFWRKIRSSIPVAGRFADVPECLPNTLSVYFEGIAGETVLMGLDMEGIAVSTGAACSSGSATPSHVLAALGASPERIASSLRFSLGWETSWEDLERVVEVLQGIVERTRGVAVQG